MSEDERQRGNPALKPGWGSTKDIEGPARGFCLHEWHPKSSRVVLYADGARVLPGDHFADRRDL